MREIEREKERVFSVGGGVCVCLCVCVCVCVCVRATHGFFQRAPRTSSLQFVKVVGAPMSTLLKVPNIITVLLNVCDHYISIVMYLKFDFSLSIIITVIALTGAI